MGPDQVEHAQAIDREICLLSSDDLGTRAVLRELLKRFSNNELRTLSLVSKLWKSEARSLLSDRGSLTANFKRDSQCQKLTAMASDLQEANTVPMTVTGIRLQVSQATCECDMPGIGQLHSNYSAILDRINWRKLSLLLWDDWEKCQNCQARLLMQKILEDRCEVLEEISLSTQTNLGEQFIQEFLQGRSFPNLKTLRIQLPAETIIPRRELNFLRLLVSNAPQLKKLYCNSLVTDSVLEGSSAVLVPTDEFDICADLSHAILSKIRLEKLTLPLEEYDFSLNMLNFNRNIPVIFQNSRNSLKSLQINLILTVPLMSYGVCFPNVRELEIQVDDRIFSEREPEMLEVVRAFDFTRIFPNLYKVEVNITCQDDLQTYLDYVDEILRTQNVALGEKMTDRAVKIKELAFDGYGVLASETVKFCAAMFPHVDKISAEVYNDEEIQLIREHWVDLKELDVKKIEGAEGGYAYDEECGDYVYYSDFNEYD